MSFYSQDFIRIKLLGDNNGSANRPACCSANGDCSSSAADPQHISPPLAECQSILGFALLTVFLWRAIVMVHEAIMQMADINKPPVFGDSF